MTAVANHCEVDPTALDPLYETIDPDALDGFFPPITKPATPPTGSIELHYAGYVVVVQEHGLGYLFAKADDENGGEETRNTRLLYGQRK